MKRYIHTSKAVSAAIYAGYEVTNDIAKDVLDEFEFVVGEIWNIVESSRGNLMVLSADNFDEQEASRLVIKLNIELKRLGLSKYVTKVDYYHASFNDDTPMKVTMTLKSYITLDAE